MLKSPGHDATQDELHNLTNTPPGDDRQLSDSNDGVDTSLPPQIRLLLVEDSQADADLKAFEDFVRAQPLVRECWMLSGEIDFILKCVAPDLKTFQAFVAELTAAPHVRNVKTALTLRNSKDAAMVPL